jgi:hypothetical protein
MLEFSEPHPDTGNEACLINISTLVSDEVSGVAVGAAPGNAYVWSKLADNFIPAQPDFGIGRPEPTPRSGVLAAKEFRSAVGCKIKRLVSRMSYSPQDAQQSDRSRYNAAASFEV